MFAPRHPSNSNILVASLASPCPPLPHRSTSPLRTGHAGAAPHSRSSTGHAPMRPAMTPATKPSGGAPAAGHLQAGRRKAAGALLRLLQAPAAVALAAALAVSSPAPGSEPLCNLPPTLSGEEGGRQGETNRIRHPKSDRAARCTSKCVSTCVLGGYGAPGVAGPFNIRRPLVVFKDTFRSRQYCLVECSDICNLLKDGEDDQ